MYKKFWLFVIVILLSATLSAQRALVSFSGSVFDSDSGEPIEFVNVVLLNTDSTFINGTTTNESGGFSIVDIPYGKAILKLSFVGYENTYTDVIVGDSSSAAIGKYSLRKNTRYLHEVVVTGTLPQYKLSNGNLIINVENTLLSSIGNGNDVMGQIPGVSVDDENNVNVFGKGSPVIYINTRKIYDANELTQLQSSDIISIEVLRNPGAKYDSENQAVIIIKTKKKIDGFSFNLSSRTYFHKHMEAIESLDMAYSTGKLNTFLSYFYSHGAEGTYRKTSHHVYSDTVWSQLIDLSSVYQVNAHHISVGADYSFSDKQIVGIRYTGSFSSGREDYPAENGNFLIYDILAENIVSKTQKKEKAKSHLLNFFYNGSFGNKFNIRFDMDYMDKKSPAHQSTNEESTITTNNTSVEIESESSFNLLAAKLTGTYKLRENARLELGAEYNNIQGTGFYKNDGNLSRNNNIYENKENKAAFFIEYGISIKGWDLDVGLRYEHSHEKMAEDSIKTVKTDRYYNDLYPSLILSKKIGDVSVNLNGNIRTKRPSFSLLNSNNIYINRFLTEQGNPSLQKEDYYEISTSILYKMISGSISYSYIKNPIVPTLLPNGGSMANSIISYTNYNNAQKISAMTSIYHNIGLWRPKLTIGIIKPFFSAVYRNARVDYNQINFNVNFNNDFVLPNNFVFSLYFLYQNDYYTYSTQWQGYTMLNARLRKSVLQDKLRFNLYINDIFNARKDGNEMRTGVYNFVMNRKNETRYFGFTIQYIFNATKKQYRGKNASDDINRL